MNQEKIGRFIAECRKNKKMTQEELAEKIGVSRKAISRWENGKNMPDLTLFKPICDNLGITVNELLSGEKISNLKYNEKLEENIINTIDYIDKKNTKNYDLKSIIYLILAILGICLSQYFYNDYDIDNYISVVSMILFIYITKRLFIKYKWGRKIYACIIIIIYILVMVLN